MIKVIWLQTPTVFWLGGGTIFLSCSIYVELVMLHNIVCIHTAEPPVPGPSAFKVEMAIEKLKGLKSPGTDQIPAELFKAGGQSNSL
jgi:hypothetical protein